MKVYVVSWTGGPTMSNCLDGTYCVCDSWDKAQHAVFAYMQEWEDTLFDVDLDLTKQLFFTSKGTWCIEQLTMNDTGL